MNTNSEEMKAEEMRKHWEKIFAEAEARKNKQALTLREVLAAMEPEEPLPDEFKEWSNFLPNSVFRICLCFMSEEVTWVYAYRDHVMLIPWYDCRVLGFNGMDKDDEHTIQIWLDYESYVKQLLEGRGSS